jgi:uncharacterized protein (TIGR03083 family)
LTAPDQPPLDEVLAALHSSHDRLVAAVGGLTDEQVKEPSYADDWSVAQVASHLGSGAEIFGMFLDAGLRGEPAPGIESIRPVWDTWNAKSPIEQAKDALRSDAQLLAQVETLTAAERADWRLDLFGSEQTLATFLRMRLSEHALHTWDVVVPGDPGATVPQDATALIVDNLSALVGRAGKGLPEPLSVQVTTSAPDRTLLLTLTVDGATLAATEEAGAATARLRLPAEAFVRLVYGRLDPDHTPASVHAEGLELGALRGAFPGV